MDGSLIVFRLKSPQNPNIASDLVKKLYGQATSNHKGKYHYRRRGLLDEIPYCKFIRGVLIIREEDKDRLIEFLKQYNAEVFVRTVKLTADDKKILKIH